MYIQGSIIDKMIFEQKQKGKKWKSGWILDFFFFYVELLVLVMDWMQVVKERIESDFQFKTEEQEGLKYCLLASAGLRGLAWGEPRAWLWMFQFEVSVVHSKGDGYTSLEFRERGLGWIC